MPQSDLIIASKSQDTTTITPYNLTEETHLVTENAQRNLQVIPKSQVTEETIVIPVRFQDGALITEVIEAFGADASKHPYTNLLKDNVANVCTLKRLTTKQLLEKEIPIEFIEWCRTQGIPIADVRSSTVISSTTTTSENELSSGGASISTSASTSLNEPPPMVEMKSKITRKEKIAKPVNKEHHKTLKAKYFNPTWWYKKLKEKEISLHAENNDETGEIIVKFGRRQFAIHTVHKHPRELVHHNHPTIVHTETQPTRLRQIEHHLYEGHEYDEEGHPVRLNFRGLPEQIQSLLHSSIQEGAETVRRVTQNHMNGNASSGHVAAGAKKGDLVTTKRVKVDRRDDNKEHPIRDTYESRKVVHM